MKSRAEGKGPLFIFTLNLVPQRTYLLPTGPVRDARCHHLLSACSGGGGVPLLVFERKVLEDVLRCQILGNVSGAEERPTAQ